MITKQELEGKWAQVKGQVRERWGQITDDELQQVHGDAEQLVGIIQQKTGQSRREIESFLDSLVQEKRGTLEGASAAARQYADEAGRKMQESYQQMGEQFEAGYDEAKHLVRSRPLESVVAAFGAGIISGVVVSLLLRPNRS